MTAIKNLTDPDKLWQVHEVFMLLHHYLDCKRYLASPKTTAAEAEWWMQQSAEILIQLPPWALKLINEDIL